MPLDFPLAQFASFIYLRGYCTPNLKLECFVWYLKIVNTFLKNDVCILKQIVQATQNGIDILVR